LEEYSFSGGTGLFTHEGGGSNPADRTVRRPSRALSFEAKTASGHVMVSGLRQVPDSRKGSIMSLGLILLIVLILMLVGGLPNWGYSRNWGYGPSGGLGLVVVIVLVLVLLGRI
jgi:Protein of unknown function (DUF3309)